MWTNIQPERRWPLAARAVAALSRKQRPLLCWFILPAATLLGLLIQQCLVSVVVVRGASMAPNFREGQVCLVDKFSGGVARGDVVIVQDGRGQAIKRVVGLPNESLLFRNGRVYVNGHELPEPYLGRATSTYPVYQMRFALGRDHYFVMGDNRGRSEDSRLFGPLPSKAVLGRVGL